MFNKNISKMGDLCRKTVHGTDLCGSQRRDPQPLHGLLSVPTLQLCCDQRLEDDRHKHDSHWTRDTECARQNRKTGSQCTQVHVHTSSYFRLRDELRDLLAGVKRSHLNVSHPPVRPPWRFQDLVMLLQYFPKTCKVQVLEGHKWRNVLRVNAGSLKPVEC